jgi:glucokinase
LGEIFMTELLLAGDIGGTSTRLRLGTRDQWRGSQWEKTYPSGNYPDLVPIVQQFLADMAPQGAIVTACFAVAGPVVDGVAVLPNLSWQLPTDRLQRELGIAQIQIINDFTAVGYGLAHLQPEEIHILQAGKPLATGPRAVIGAGTGLGQGYVIPLPEGDLVLASEGGHSDFAARTPREFALVEYLMARYGWDHVSGDRVISGRGIVDIYRFLRDTPETFAPEQPGELPEIASALAQWEQHPESRDSQPDPAAAIAHQAPTDPLCRATMDMFVTAYGAEAGNLALKFLPWGGLYIAGGVAAKNLDLMKDGRFMGAFGQKGRTSDVIAQIPVYLVLNPQVGLLGAAARALARTT